MNPVKSCAIIATKIPAAVFAMIPFYALMISSGYYISTFTMGTNNPILVFLFT